MKERKVAERNVPDHVLALLEEMNAEANVIHAHPRKLDRQDYLDMNKVLEALGGKWKGHKVQGHVFPEGTDVAMLVDTVLATGRYEDPKDADFVQTPILVASRMADLGRVRRGHKVLEPSAGLGRIANAAIRMGASVTCIELSEKRCAELQVQGFGVVCGDFLQQHPAADKADFDVVLMNPPFSRQQDIDHVRHAYQFVKSGGRIVAIMSAGVTFRQNRKTVEFREWVDSLGGTIEELPEGTFKAEGTMVRTVIVVIDVP